MIERLGYVLYWFCCIAAGLALIGSVTTLFGTERELFFFFAVVALVIYGIGRAVRYVLVGK